jgi:hypothetical protein
MASFKAKPDGANLEVHIGTKPDLCAVTIPFGTQMAAAAADDEIANQIVRMLDEHVSKSHRQDLLNEGTTDIARQRLDALPSFVDGDRLAGLTPH